jgi:RNA polymerase sigma-70 factor (ECF subfamily)
LEASLHAGMSPVELIQRTRKITTCQPVLAYLRDVDAAPIQPIGQPLKTDRLAAGIALDPTVLDQLWQESASGEWGLLRSDFDRIILLVAIRQNFGLQAGAIAGKAEQAAFFKGVRLADLVLASACAEGNERAWEHFVHLYGALLTRAAIAISGSETIGRDLADAFYAELYGLNSREGVRKCPLESYRGRGSLLGWLRATLSQRFVDHYRRTFREEALDDKVHDTAAIDASPETDEAVSQTLRDAIRDTLSSEAAEDRFLLAAYFLDSRTLAEIGQLLHVHEATVSRRLKRATEAMRKRLVRSLEQKGMSRRAAEEALGTDPRDLDLHMDLRKLLQYSQRETFLEQDGVHSALESKRVTEPSTSQTRVAISTDTGGEK